LILAFTGGVAGLLLALWGVELLVKTGPANMPRIDEIGLDMNVLAFTFLVSIATGVLFGLTPALGASKVDLNEVMKEGGRGSTEKKGSRSIRSGLVIAEVALSLVLVIGTGLLIKSFMRLMATDPGYDTEHVFSMTLPLSTARYPKPEQQAAFFQELIRLAREVPGVEAAGATTTLPLSGRDVTFDFQIEGRPAAPSGEEPIARYTVVSPTYFETMRMPILRGRPLSDRDAANAPQVMVVSEAFARHFFPDEDAIGRRIVPNDPEAPPREIVGVVGDIRQAGLDKEVLPIVYVPHLQDPDIRMDLVVRTASESPADLAPAMRNVIRQMNKDQLIWQTRTMSQLLSKSVAARRFNMVLLATFTVVALALSVIGIFGVMNYAVIQRTHEIGIRMALGAQRGHVLRMVIGQGMALVLVGLCAGLAGAVALTRLLSSLLYGVSATDPLVFAEVAILFAAVSLIACYLPARRAMRIDPLAAIRYE
jgi:putative ABC transport system permease protein